MEQQREQADLMLGIGLNLLRNYYHINDDGEVEIGNPELNLQRYYDFTQPFEGIPEEQCEICKDREDTEYSICLCGSAVPHVFHTSCLKELFKYNPMCPLCNRRF
jgi:hypothetical protein